MTVQATPKVSCVFLEPEEAAPKMYLEVQSQDHVRGSPGVPAHTASSAKRPSISGGKIAVGQLPEPTRSPPWYFSTGPE